MYRFFLLWHLTGWIKAAVLCRIFHTGRRALVLCDVMWKNVCASDAPCFVFQSKEIGIQMHEELVKVTNELYTVSSPDPTLAPRLIPAVRRFWSLYFT